MTRFTFIALAASALLGIYEGAQALFAGGLAVVPLSLLLHLPLGACAVVFGGALLWGVRPLWRPGQRRRGNMRRSPPGKHVSASAP